MNVLFTVQGEGRGHLTQALGFQQILERHGHQVVGVIVGHNGTRRVPDYFARGFSVPIVTIQSPGFRFMAGRGVSLAASVWDCVIRLPRFRESLRIIEDQLQCANPDLVVNFLEPLLGTHRLFRGNQWPTLAVGHQYLLNHPAFVPVAKRGPQLPAMRAYVALTGWRATKLALSFYPAPDVPERNLHVGPPILREQLFRLEPADEGYLLVYLLNHGYATDIIRWHARNRPVRVHCFYDKPGAPLEEEIAPGLVFHRLDGEKFLRMMARCSAVVTTAGFESVSEAAYLGKPVLMVPVENHIEQCLNAWDAERAGLGIWDREFNLGLLMAAGVPRASSGFRDWVNRAESVVIRVIESIAARRCRRFGLAEDNVRPRGASIRGRRAPAWPA